MKAFGPAKGDLNVALHIMRKNSDPASKPDAKKKETKRQNKARRTKSKKQRNKTPLSVQSRVARGYHTLKPHALTVLAGGAKDLWHVWDRRKKR